MNFRLWLAFGMWAVASVIAIVAVHQGPKPPKAHPK